MTAFDDLLEGRVVVLAAPVRRFRGPVSGPFPFPPCAASCGSWLLALLVLTRSSQPRRGRWFGEVMISTISPVCRLILERDQAPVDLGADTVIADLGMDGVGKIDGAAARAAVP